MESNFNLDRYKDANGNFKALAMPYDPYWLTPRGQDYLKEFYLLEEAYRLGFINMDELNVYHDQLTHPGKPCPFSETYHALFEGATHVNP